MSVVGSFPPSGKPSWTCFLDGKPLISDENDDGRGQNNVVLCLSNNTLPSAPSATPSNLTVVASGTPDTPFLFDHIQYTPDASVILDNATVVVNATDPQIFENSGWKAFSLDLGLKTSVPGSSLVFDFIGAFRL